jgi:UDP-N-acetylglucosamine acyltransferase
VIGLRRRGFAEETIRALKRAYRTVFQGSGTLEEALAAIRAAGGHVPEVGQLVRFIAASERGVCRP